jgi:hypothetical protein
MKREPETITELRDEIAHQLHHKGHVRIDLTEGDSVHELLESLKRAGLCTPPPGATTRDMHDWAQNCVTSNPDQATRQLAYAVERCALLQRCVDAVCALSQRPELASTGDLAQIESAVFGRKLQ